MIKNYFALYQIKHTVELTIEEEKNVLENYVY